MSKELSKRYPADPVEKKWSAFWREEELFRADPESGKPPYCIVIPPPNVTGTLHMGHALVNTLQDILIRWKRMSGFEALWVPGTDHAGIATQTVVERHLMKTTGKRRTEFSRKEFLEQTWSWKEKSEGIIVEQLKRLGCSCDWSRQRFTMDEQSDLAVKTAFKKLYDAGLIYQGDYLVNWDPVTQTALADDEVEHEERASFLWHIRYPLKEAQGALVVATTRPETLLGDTAVAVSPNDSRYSELIGASVRLPLANREIPIIADHRVDPAFGSGAVKITPAHDPNDYQIGLDHDLPFINIMTPDGRINEAGGEFSGLSMAEAREAVVEKLKQADLIEKIEPHTHRVGISYRSKATIEPYLSKQWFVKMEPFSEEMKRAVLEGKVELKPKEWSSVYFHWIDHLRDWCISRQLWWGHRIPIWYSKNSPEKKICYDGQGEPPEVRENPDDWVQDEDVLDTWFSSSLWPFSALGWPEKTKELERFYPNSTLVTGHDILFFWVARMIMMGQRFMGQPPFAEVFLHGLIYGKSYWRQNPSGGISYVEQEEKKEYDLGKPLPKEVFCKWEKMSKSKGNVIDPLEIIREYGADAMRIGLAASSPQSREIDLDRRRFEEFKNFINKLWNGARFIFTHLDGSEEGLPPLTPELFSEGLDESLFALEDRWIFSVLNRRIQSMDAHLRSYSFDKAAFEAYDFFWNELCAYYVEISKPLLFGKRGSQEERRNKQKILAVLLSNAIRLIHPIAPFITEELFSELKQRLGTAEGHPSLDSYTKECIESLKAKACSLSLYPSLIREAAIEPSIEESFSLMGEIVYALRNLRGELKIPPGKEVELHVTALDNASSLETLQANEAILRALTRISSIHYHKSEPELLASATAVVKELKITIPLPEEQLAQEKFRLQKELQKLQEAVLNSERKLDNRSFLERAPKELLERHQALLEEQRRKLRELEDKLSKLLIE